MAASPAPKPLFDRRPTRFAGLLVALACACQGAATTTPSDAVSFDDTPLTAQATAGNPLSSQTPAQALRRLDRLLDLFDAARFSGDPQLRDAFWSEMGENPARTEGPAATRNALALLLEQAYGLEDRGGLDDDGQEVLAELIQLLATDLHRPAAPEDQAVQTLVYRQLSLEGNPRVADNASWRLYDFLRGTADAAVRAPADRRPFIVSHARLAVDGERSDIAAPPSAQEITGWIEAQRARIAKVSRWKEIAAKREPIDAQLEEQLDAVLPAKRFSDWALYSLPAATTKQDSLAPVLYVSSESSAVDPIEPKPRTGLSPRSEALRDQLRQSLARDGRGIVMVVCEPQEPASVFSSALELVAAQAIDRIEFAVRDHADAPVRALPLVLARPGPSPGSQAFLQATLRLHLDGATVAIVREGESPIAGEAQPVADALPTLQGLAKAFPDERAIALTVSRRVSVSQLLDLIVVADAAGLGTLGLVVDGRPVPDVSPALASEIEVRTRLVGAKVVLDQPYPLPKGDQQAIEGGLAQVGRCLGELGVRPKRGSVALALTFEDGEKDTSFKIRGVPPDRVEAFEACSAQALRRVQLQEHRDRYEMRARWFVEK